jgi:hypothetical protein
MFDYGLGRCLHAKAASRPQMRISVLTDAIGLHPIGLNCALKKSDGHPVSAYVKRQCVRISKGLFEVEVCLA